LGESGIEILWLISLSILTGILLGPEDFVRESITLDTSSGVVGE